jgi:hypothetical protein
MRRKGEGPFQIFIKVTVHIFVYDGEIFYCPRLFASSYCYDLILFFDIFFYVFWLAPFIFWGFSFDIFWLFLKKLILGAEAASYNVAPQHCEYRETLFDSEHAREEQKTFDKKHCITDIFKCLMKFET